MIDPGRFERVARIDSTNSALMRRPFAEGPQPACALMADRQDAGRGRNGRVWRFEATRSLALSPISLLSALPTLSRVLFLFLVQFWYLFWLPRCIPLSQVRYPA